MDHSSTLTGLQKALGGERSPGGMDVVFTKLAVDLQNLRDESSEEVLQGLGLPYRVVNVCSGDLGQGQAQKFDIECWMPSRGWGETHSASRFYDFQARRLDLRYRDANGKMRFCHTLNNTVIATPRVLIPILENGQQADGSVRLPEALVPYMGGREVIEPRHRA